MLGACGIIAAEEAERICAGLEGILQDLKAGTLQIDPEAEDIHTFIEGGVDGADRRCGKRLHTARSRNDQVALDIRLTLKKEAAGLSDRLQSLIRVLCDKAEAYAAAVMPGYTHLQRAQPITFGHHLMAYAEMFLRDVGRLKDAVRRMDQLPARLLCAGGYDISHRLPNDGPPACIFRRYAKQPGRGGGPRFLCGAGVGGRAR